MDNCIFCNINNYVLENELAYAIYDKFPVSKGHLLIISKRHVSGYFDATKEEKLAIYDLVDKCKELLEKEYSPDGYNVGINIGEAGGQTVMHLHVHLIPRYNRDVEDPRGGIRGAVPDKMKY